MPLDKLTNKILNAEIRFKETYPRTHDLLNFGARFVTYSLTGACAGAIAGEILDNMPYFSEALPKAAELMSSMRTNHNQEIYNLFLGNLDKISAFGG